MVRSEIEWLKNFSYIPLLVKLTPYIYINALLLPIDNSYSKNKHIWLRHNLIKQLLKSETISIDYVKLEHNLVGPLTKKPNEEIWF